MMTIWYAVVVWCAALVGADRLPPVTLRRCCGLGEQLVATDPGWTCGNGSGTWLPRVYAPARRIFLERGVLPVHWSVVERAPPACEGPRLVPDEHTVPYMLYATNGSLLVRRDDLVLDTERFCVEEGGALVCGEVGEAAAVKCCPAGEVVDVTGARCVRGGDPGAERELADLGVRTALGGGWPACAKGYGVVGSLAGGRLAGGTLELGGAQLAAGGWCADLVLGEAGGARVLACEGGRTQSGRHLLYGAGLAVGAAFLAATLAAGLLLPAAHRALHWRCQTHYVATLMLGDILLASTQLAGNTVPFTLCKIIAVCMHFLFLSAFFWLNTMCFNIWWTFRDFRPTSLERGQETCRLRVYMVYAWGGPLVVAGTAALLDHLPPHPAYTFLRPRFAVQRCWFYGDMEILTYFFGPVGILLLVNLALFVTTTRQLTCGLWRRDEVKSTSERAALGRVCAKLVVVMGVTWGADVLSWASGGPDYVWYVTDLLNALQGVFIFVVVGCQPAVWGSVKRGWSRLTRGRAGESGTNGAGAALHSSSHLPSLGDSLTHTTAAPAAPQKIPMETAC